MWNNDVDRSVLVAHLALHGWAPYNFYDPYSRITPCLHHTTKGIVFVSGAQATSLNNSTVNGSRLRPASWFPRPLLVQLANAAEVYDVA